jgi:UDP-N-acetylmuramoylalanine--D-glutamate ligase
VTGLAAARALLELGAEVTVTESGDDHVVVERAARLRAAGATVHLGGHDIGSLTAGVAVVSPGIAPFAPVVAELEARGIEVVGEIELAHQLARCDLLAVTGTNGKTTTTTLLAAMLAEGGIETIAAGNIGLPLVEAVGRVGEGGAVAVEVSSFQLDAIRSFRPKVAVLLNLAEDHTDWHGSFDAYSSAKARIVANQSATDAFVVNADDPHAMAIAARAPSRVVPFSTVGVPDEGIGFEHGMLTWRGTEIVARDEVPLPGVAGLEDAAAAAGAALEYGVEPAAVARALRGFTPLAHRLQVVAEVGGVTYIDDSKATNPHATLAALRGMSGVVLIAGGRAKNIDLTPLADAAESLSAVVALGEAAAEIEAVFGDFVTVERVSSMRAAVERARARAAPGGSVLLSPACASLDMYESYAARGDDFARAVMSVTSEETEGHSHKQ